jgi:hypothetical protein
LAVRTRDEEQGGVERGKWAVQARKWPRRNVERGPWGRVKGRDGMWRMDVRSTEIA